MRILHVVGRSHRRGAEIVALELAAELEARGHRNTFSAVGPGHLGDTLPELPALTGSVRQDPLTLLRAARALRRSLRREPVDVVLAHGGSALQAAVIASASLRRYADRRTDQTSTAWLQPCEARLPHLPSRNHRSLFARAVRAGSRPPVVYQLILGMPADRRGRLWHRWWRWLLARTAGAVALTEVLADEIVPLGLDSPVWTIPNARSAKRFRDLDRDECRRKLRADLGVEAGVGLVGFVGHLVEQKRPDRAVEVLVALAGAEVPAHLVVVGDGPLAEAVQRQVDAAGVGDQVSLLGHRTDVERLLAGFDVFGLTSQDEGMPGVVIEALMAGCPVIAFPVGGAAEVIGTEGAGTVTSSHDVREMAAAMAALLTNPAQLAAASAAARARSERFSMEVVAVDYERLLAEVSERGNG